MDLFRKKSLARVLAMYIMGFGFLVALLSASVQLYHEYNHDRMEIEQSMEEIHKTMEALITESLWITSDALAAAAMQGILNLPNIESVKITKANNDILLKGRSTSRKTLVHEHGISKIYRGEKVFLGTIEVTASLDHVFSRVLGRSLIIVGSQAVWSILLSLAAMVMFYKLVGRHLYTMSAYAGNISIDTLETPLHLAKRGTALASETDEIGRLETAINFMRKRLKSSLDLLTKKEKQFRSLVESTKATAWELDLETMGFTYMSPRILDLTGYAPDMWTGFEFWKQTLHPEDRDAAVNFCRIETEKGKDHEFEYRMIAADGRVIWIRDLVTVLKDNKPPLMRGYFFDITAQKKATLELQRSEEKFSKAFGSVPLLMTISTIKEGRYLEINEAFIQTTGYTRRMAIGKTSIELGFISENDRKKILQSLNAIGRVSELELHLNKSDGSILVCLYSGEIIEVDGQPCLLSIAMDITEREKIEKQLLHAQKMESIGSLAGGIAHDFNNLLFPIVGLSEMMLDDFPPESMEHQNIREIYNASTRGRALVQQILSFSRQSGHQPIPVHIQKILNEVLKLCRATIPADIPITRDIKTDCRPVMADPTQIHQIAMNLITNAYHAVERAGGIISIQLKEMDVTSTNDPAGDLAPGRYAVLSVSDTGIGIDEAVIDKIFDPYFTTKEKGRGTGLGLATVYGIVKAHGGDIRVHSAIGKGAAFHVYLPLMEKTQQSEPEKETTPLPTGTEHILLVDDEKSIIHLEKQMLERLGYQTSVFTSSRDALTAFKTEPSLFDLVITDMNMPDMNGMQLATELIAIRPDTPIILCTGFSERINNKNAEALGIRGLLMKPVGMKDLAQKIQEVMALEKKRSE